MNTAYYAIMLYKNPSEAGQVLADFITGQIPTVAEIEPQPDPVYGHVFRWPAREIAQFATANRAQPIPA